MFARPTRGDGGLTTRAPQPGLAGPPLLLSPQDYLYQVVPGLLNDGKLEERGHLPSRASFVASQRFEQVVERAGDVHRGHSQDLMEGERLLVAETYRDAFLV